MEVERPQLAAVVAGRHAQQAGRRAARGHGLDAGAHRGADVGVGQAVDHDLHHASDAGVDLGLLRQAGQRGAERIVGAGHQRRVLAAHLGAGAHHAARERHDHVGQRLHRGHRRLGRRQCRIGVGRQQQQVAAAHALGDGGGFLGDEFAVHHRHTPVADAADHLAGLPAVAEETQVLAQRHRLAFADAGVHRRGGAGEHALTDALLDLLGEFLAAHREDQDRDARAAVGRLSGGDLALDAGLAAAGDHRGGEAGGGHRRMHRPGGVVLITI